MKVGFTHELEPSEEFLKAKADWDNDDPRLHDGPDPAGDYYHIQPDFTAPNKIKDRMHVLVAGLENEYSKTILNILNTKPVKFVVIKRGCSLGISIDTVIPIKNTEIPYVIPVNNSPDKKLQKNLHKQNIKKGWKRT